MAPPLTDEQLVPALAREDERAVEELVARYWERAYKVAHQLTGDATAAEDVAQETFVKVLRAAGRFDPQRSFRAWFFGILRNEASQHRRTKQRRERRDGAGARPDRAATDFGDAGEAVRTYLSRLPARSRDALVLHYLEGFTHQEIADLLECPRTTVATHIKRGLEAIRAGVQPIYGLAPAALIGHLRHPTGEVPRAPGAAELVGPPQPASLAAAVRRRAPPWLIPLGALILGGLAVAALTVDLPGQAPAGPAPVAQAAPIPAPPEQPDPPPARRSPEGGGTTRDDPASAPGTAREEEVERGASTQPGADAAQRAWGWGDAERVVEGGKLGSRPTASPLGLVWSGSELWLATTSTALAGATPQATVQLWRRDQDSWRAAGTPIPAREGRFQRFFSLGPDLGLLSGGGYGSGVWFHRVDVHGQILLAERLLAPQEGRLSVSSVSVESDRLLTVVVLEERTPPLKNQLLVLRSHNLGAGWSQTAALETTMSEDWCRMHTFQWSELCLGRFTVEEPGQSVKFLRSEDGALSWTSTTLELSDELGPGALRFPLDGLQAGGTAGLVYLGVAGKDGSGKYYFSRSTDQGGTWEPGRPMTPELKVDDASSVVQLAASGEVIAFAYQEILEGGNQHRLLISQDGGIEWTGVPLDGPPPRPGTLVLASRRGAVALAGLRASGSEEGQELEVFVRELTRR